MSVNTNTNTNLNNDFSVNKTPGSTNVGVDVDLTKAPGDTGPMDTQSKAIPGEKMGHFTVTLPMPDHMDSSVIVNMGNQAVQSNEIPDNANVFSFIKQNPTSGVLLALLKKKYENQGMSSKDAQTQAEDQLLANIKSNQTGDMSIADAIKLSIKKEILVDPDISVAEGEEIAESVSVAMNEGQEFLTYLQGLANISANSETAGINAQAAKTMMHAANTSQDIVNHALTLINQAGMSDSDKQVLTSFLEKMAAAISALQQLLAEISNRDANIAQQNTANQLEMDKAKFEDTMKQLQDQWNQLMEQEEQEKRNKKLAPLFKYILPCLSALIVPFCGPGAMAICIAVTAVTTALSATGNMTKVMDAIGTAVGKMVGIFGGSDALQNALKSALTIAIIVIVASKGGSAVAGTGVKAIITTQLLMTMLTSSQAIQQAVTACYEAAGDDPKDPAIANKIAITSAVVTALVCIISSMAIGSGAGAQTQSVGSKLDKILTVVRYVAIAGQVTGAGLQANASYISAQSEQAQASMLADAASQQILIDLLTSMVSQLQQVIQQIESGGKDISDFINSLSQLFNSIVSLYSNIETNLSQSS